MLREPANRMDSDRERALVARSRSDASAFGELYDYEVTITTLRAGSPS